jgi:hypothetical protein
MARVMVPHHAPSAATAKVIPLRRVPGLQQAATLAQKIDDLAELRALIRKATATERELTGEVLTELAALRVSHFEGTAAVAVLEHRTCLKPDPELFVEALGRASYAALTVSVSKAREMIGEQDLQAISEATTTPALRIETRTPEAA